MGKRFLYWRLIYDVINSALLRLKFGIMILASVVLINSIKPFLCFQETAERCVVRLQGQTDEDLDEDLDEESGVGSEIHLRRQVTRLISFKNDHIRD